MKHNNMITILMFPWLAHGHISPFLELAKKLTLRNFFIQFCSTPTNLTSIKQKIAAVDNQSERFFSESIQLVVLNLPNLPELHPHYHTTKILPPHLMPTLKKAFEMAKPEFSNILKELKPDLVIYDIIQPWVPETALVHNIPAVEFVSTGAAMTSFMLHKIKNPGADFPFQEIYLQDYEEAQIAHLMEFALDPRKDRDRPGECLERSVDIVLIKTCKEIEGKYFDYLSELLGKKIVPVGPIVEDIVVSEEEVDYKNSIIMEWLNKKKRSSTVFVSFGSELFLTKEEMEEIAMGLELSDVDFIWVVRFPAGDQEMRVEDALPEGFLERVGEKGKGMVVKGWAPQAKILVHENVGGFVSHCGWSSSIEAMKFGVPIMAVPMINDQPINARVLENIGIGVGVVKDEGGRIQREKLATAIKQVILEETGKDLRRKASLLSEKIRSKGEEEIDVVTEELVKICKK
ncbi:hypothetical protein ACH5RR_016462 [Cinchona calisaya]|uniref:Glycosyltransferase n=1 Tax=Cinchona calisaya TaxID=153742 RepID=A0ABD2ZX79_9GENT